MTPANMPDLSQRRAHLAVAAAASAVVAKAHIEKAIHHAHNGRLDIAVSSDLRTCLAAIDRTVRHAEQCRLRLLRKADRITRQQSTEE